MNSRWKVSTKVELLVECFNMLLVFNIILTLGWINLCYAVEPAGSCFKQFEYEYGVLQKMVQLEEKLNKQEVKIATLTQELKDSDDALRRLQNTLPMETKSISSTYVRWGRTICPHGAQLVYHGYTAGGEHAKSGSAANKLCLPSDPLWGNYTDGVQSGAGIYGGEYEVSAYTHSKHLHDKDVPCVVCRVPRSNVLMVPGRNECYKNFNLEYSGYLMSGRSSHPSSTEYICMDGNPEVLDGGHENLNGDLFYFVEAMCGSLRCPPYVNGRELTCVVCSWSP